jgi:hypothetical protein
MKVKRYILPAKPERTVITLPLLGSKTLVSTLMSAIRQESIPRTAKVTTLYNRRTGARNLRVEFPTV